MVLILLFSIYFINLRYTGARCILHSCVTYDAVEMHTKFSCFYFSGLIFFYEILYVPPNFLKCPVKMPFSRVFYRKIWGNVETLVFNCTYFILLTFEILKYM